MGGRYDYTIYELYNVLFHRWVISSVLLSLLAYICGKDVCNIKPSVGEIPDTHLKATLTEVKVHAYIYYIYIQYGQSHFYKFPACIPAGRSSVKKITREGHRSKIVAMQVAMYMYYMSSKVLWQMSTYVCRIAMDACDGLLECGFTKPLAQRKFDDTPHLIHNAALHCTILNQPVHVWT